MKIKIIETGNKKEPYNFQKGNGDVITVYEHKVKVDDGDGHIGWGVIKCYSPNIPIQAGLEFVVSKTYKKKYTDENNIEKYYTEFIIKTGDNPQYSKAKATKNWGGKGNASYLRARMDEIQAEMIIDKALEKSKQIIQNGYEIDLLEKAKLQWSYFSCLLKFFGDYMDVSTLNGKKEKEEEKNGKGFEKKKSVSK